ncbi:MAG: hypothetical protein V7765_12260 [Oleispira sp.]
MVRRVKIITESKNSNHCCQPLEPEGSHMFSLSKLLIDIQRDVKNKLIENASVKTPNTTTHTHHGPPHTHNLNQQPHE